MVAASATIRYSTVQACELVSSLAVMSRRWTAASTVTALEGTSKWVAKAADAALSTCSCVPSLANDIEAVTDQSVAGVVVALAREAVAVVTVVMEVAVVTVVVLVTVAVETVVVLDKVAVVRELVLVMVAVVTVAVLDMVAVVRVVVVAVVTVVVLVAVSVVWVLVAVVLVSVTLTVVMVAVTILISGCAIVSESTSTSKPWSWKLACRLSVKEDLACCLEALPCRSLTIWLTASKMSAASPSGATTSNSMFHEPEGDRPTEVSASTSTES